MTLGPSFFGGFFAGCGIMLMAVSGRLQRPEDIQMIIAFGGAVIFFGGLYLGQCRKESFDSKF